MLKEIRIFWDKSRQAFVELQFNEARTLKLRAMQASTKSGYIVYDDQEEDSKSARNRLIDSMLNDAIMELSALTDMHAQLRQGVTYHDNSIT